MRPATSPLTVSAFSPIYGNADLSPETAKSWEIGFLQPILENKCTFGLTYFDQKYEDMIDFEFSTSRI